jgi:hypothetical protein
VQQPVVRSLRTARLAARTRGDGLDALSLALAQDAERVRRERLTLLAASEMRADLLEVRAQSAHGRAVHFVAHACTMHASDHHGYLRQRLHRRMERQSG